MGQGGTEQSVKASAYIMVKSLPSNFGITCFEIGAATQCIVCH